ncbi:sodium channel protein Nach-like [Cotesia glomerata]|uniref:sodium channel protein Nach-like n=1 Tax=Cotesia glomerata TaxID=32391 RepID=UPI001D00AE78|nr:sodium channel protein Nach-like [Cotesia glomerata]
MMNRRYFPPLHELKKSFKLRSREYLSENTLHGFRYFVDSSRPTWERFVWFLCTVLSLCAALGIIVTIFEKFVTNPTLTGVVVGQENSQNMLPSITLCMTSDYLDLSRVSEDEGITYESYYNWDWKPIVNITSPKLSQSLSDIFLQITPSCDNLLADCFKQGIRKHCKKIFKKMLTPAGICCKSLTAIARSANDDMKSRFTLKYYKKFINLYFFGNDEEIPERESPISYTMRRNMEFMLSLTVTDASGEMRILTHSQRQCIFYDEGISYNNCMMECRKKTIHKVCGCLPWFYSKNKLEECSLEQYSCLSDNENRLRTPKCASDCYLYCNHTTYIFETIVNGDVTVVDARWPLVRYRREVRFGWLDLVVSFGGIMGLFLGYSILTTIELIYYFSLRFYCGAVVVHDDHINKRFKIINVIKKPKQVKLPTTMMYYDYVE